MKPIAILPCLLMAFLLRAQEPSIIPKPVMMTLGKGSFPLTASTSIVLQGSGLNKAAAFLNDYLQEIYGFRLATALQSPKSNAIVLNFERMDHLIAGAYRMDVNSKMIYIAGDNEQGVFYGIQTLIQSMPVDVSPTLEIPLMKVEDYPRFAYRGLHLDVGRHFFPVAYIKRYIDFIALHKMNYFHWHLTEDQGWRIEIKKYPQLTAVGSCRNGTIIGRAPGRGSDSIRYCGYYTQDQIRDVVKYAADRYISIIPEIEMPGHATAALTAYPWLGCTGGPYQVQERWGVFNDIFCAGNDSSFRFLQDVLDEVMALFPSKYIHIGGDEAPKTAWKKCPKCQRRIKENGLKDEHELQSYFIQHIEKYINSKGRQIIGWDEILEGGLAPNATVMSWRGEQGGIDAAKQNHDVIMTPGQYVYFDHAQKKNEDSLTIGGYLPLETVYGYEPIPAVLTTEQAGHVLGAQANLWTEYISNTAKLEYMLFPRISALSEVLWSPKEGRNWDDFQSRLQTQFKRYGLWKVNYSRAYFDLKVSIEPTKDYQGVLWKLESNDKLGRITISGAMKGSGSQPVSQPYTEPVLIKASQTLTGEFYIQDKLVSSLTENFRFNKATGKKISLTTLPSNNFPGNGGAFGLVNGAQSQKGINSDEWLGWQGADMEAMIDMGNPDTLSEVSLHVLDLHRNRCYAPSAVEIFGSSDGILFSSLGKTSIFRPEVENMGIMSISFPPVLYRYVKILAKNYGTIPEGQPGAGNPARLLTDEIQIN